MEDAGAEPAEAEPDTDENQEENRRTRKTMAKIIDGKAVSRRGKSRRYEEVEALKAREFGQGNGGGSS